MAAIRETLTMEDRFSAAFTNYIRLGDRAAGATQQAQMSARNYQTVLSGLDRRLIALNGEFAAGVRRQEAMAAAGMQNTQQFAQLDNRMERLGGTIRDLEAQYRAVSEDAEKAARSSRGAAEAFRSTDQQASRLTGTITRLAGAYLSLRSVGKLAGLSDTLSQTNARLDRMNYGMQTTAELQEMIYQSAMRSRGVYADTADFVAKLGTLAREAFASNEELVAFAEQINKQMVLSGASAAGAQGAMLQLTQALSSGVLRGEELNSVLEQTPMIAQTIAEYMGVTTGEMRELASEGAITADTVKNALLNAAERTDEAFNKMPLTFSQMGTMFRNEFIHAVRPGLEELSAFLNSDTGQQAFNGLLNGARLAGEGISWLVGLAQSGAELIVQNWDTVSAILITGAVLIGVAMVQSAVASGTAMVSSAAASAAAWLAANWPLLAVIGTIYLMVAAARWMGATWEDIGGVVGGGFGLMYAFAMNNFIVPAQNGFARFANFFGNFLNDPVASVEILFLDMAQTVLGYFSNIAHGMEDLINKIPGMEVSLTGGIDSVYNMVKSASQNAKDASGWKEYVKAWDFVDYSNAWTDWSAKGRSAANAIENFSLSDIVSSLGGGGFDYASMLDNSAIAGQLENISADTGALRREVALEQEDIKALVDMAERRYVNNINLTAQTPVINVSGANTGSTQADRQALANTIRDILLEQAAAGSVLTTARAF